jgi:hypothetical protein
MTITTTIILILAIPLVLWAIRADSRRWTTRSREDLIGMLGSDDWKYWKLAMKELRRRGEDTSIYVPHLMPRLLADTQMVREAARITLASHFPEVRDHLSDYRAADDVNISRKKLTSLFEKYGVGQK